MRAPIAATACAVVWLGAAPSGAVDFEQAADRSDQTFRKYVGDWIAKQHFHPEHFDTGPLVIAAEQRSRQGWSPARVHAWLDEKLLDQYLAFARPSATHDDQVRYRLPFRIKIPRYLGQGVGGEISHSDAANYYAFDFVLPIGEEILAARPGVVARVSDGFTKPTLDPSLGYRKNGVLVLHEDGTYAQYLHLNPGVPVAEGDAVGKGDLIGYSGHTGYSLSPHLHFAVLRRGPGGRRESLPIRFGGGTGFVPKAKEFYGTPGPSKAQLRILVDGQVIAPQDGVPIRRGESAGIEVEWVRGPGNAVDVTADPATEYATMTPWSMSVEASGRVTARTVPGYEKVEGGKGVGIAWVAYGAPGEPSFGFRTVWFRIVEPGGTP